MSASFEHERNRLYALVDRFIELQAEGAAQLDDVRIDEAVLVCGVSGVDDDGDPIEAVLSTSETKRGWVRVGLLHTAAQESTEHLTQ